MRIVPKLIAAILLCSALVLPAVADDDAPPTTLQQNDVLGYLEQLIAWQRDAASIEPAIGSARELIFEDALHQNSLQVLQSGFKFARAASLDPSLANDDTDTDDDDTKKEQAPHQRIIQRAQQADADVKALNIQIASASGKAKSDLQDQLKIAQAKQELYQSVVANINAVETGEAHGFKGKIQNLIRAVPDLSTKKEKDAGATTALTLPNVIPGMPAAQTAATTTTVQPHTGTSIISLMSDSYDIARKQRELDDFLLETDKLVSTSHRLLSTLRNQLDTVIAPTQNQSVDAKVAAYKQVGAEITPLGDATMRIDINKNTIQDWQDTLQQQLKSLLRQLALHLGILAVMLAIPLIISSVLKRTIKRYIADPKRQRQAQTARRILAGIVVVFILLLNFISDFSSFATFAGFLTAGLAVALQSVLLSFVCHFFFYGRYGVRKGDRVTVNSVTGDILQIGIMRFYLSELIQGTDGSFKPTGRVVVFPNSILFQPAAFYKYV